MRKKVLVFVRTILRRPAHGRSSWSSTISKRIHSQLRISDLKGKKKSSGQKGRYKCNRPVTDEMKSSSNAFKQKSNVTENVEKGRIGSGGETVIEAEKATNKTAPPGDVNNSNMWNIMLTMMLLLKSIWTIALLLKSSRTKASLQRQSKGPLKTFLLILQPKIILLLCQLAFMDRNVLKVNRNQILIALPV